MANLKNKTAARVDVQANIFNVAKTSGEATRVVVDMLRGARINWSKDESVAIFADSFKLGRLAGYLGLVDRAAAQAIADLKPFKDGDASDSRRTLAQHKAWRAAISAWSHCALLAGQPNKRTGKTRASKANVAKPTDTATTVKDVDGSISPAMLAVSRAKTVDDVLMFALRVADVFTKYESHNASIKMGDVGTAMRAYVEAVRKVKLG